MNPSLGAALVLVNVWGSGDAHQASPQTPSSEAPAPAHVLSVGDPAPGLWISSWVKGEPVAKLERGRSYVIEFWATWFAPGLDVVTQLTDLQKKHEDDFTIIGVSGPDPRGETLDRVREFVAGQGAGIGYTIAFDDGTRTRRAWMDAAEQAAIPTAFVVEPGGKIAWIGNPMGPALGHVMEQISSGTFDLEKAVAEAKEAAAKREAAKKIQKRIELAMERGDNSEVLRGFDELYALNFSLVRGVPVYKFRYMLSILKDEAGAYAYIRPLLAGDLKDEPAPLHEVAWIIATTPGLKNRDMDLALKSVERAAELTEHKNSEILDSLARVRYERDEFGKAVEAEKKAVEVETDEVARQEFQRNLEHYEKARKAGAKVERDRPGLR